MKSEEKVMEIASLNNKSTEEDGDYWIRDIVGDKKFEDEYLLGDIIGRGASSIVYKCLRKGRTEWACKILKKKQLSKKSVQSDIRALLQLKHPNLVQLKDVFETKEEIQLILEVAHGGELFERIVERGQYSEVDAARAVRHILNALQYLHTNGIIHKDLKPENLLYKTEADDSVLKLADCGMSKLLSDEFIKSSRSCVNLGYTAPEVLLNKSYDSTIDLWSLGVVAYIMLCGFEPFWDEQGEATIIKKITEGDYSFPSPWWDNISPSAKEIVSKMLSVDPSDRPSAEKCLSHPWILGISTPTLHMNETVLRLKEFNARRRFRVATKAVIATRRALNLLSPTKRNSRDIGKEINECSCDCAAETTTNGSCCENSSLESSACGKCSKLSSLPVESSACGFEKSSLDGEGIGKTNKLVPELSQYKENFVGLG